MANVRLQADEDPLFRSEALLQEGRFGEVVELLSPLLQAGRGGLLLRTLLTRGLLGAGKREQGLALARDTAQLYPGVGVASLSLGEALLASGRPPLAIAEFQRALRSDPGLAEARYLLGCAWLEAGEAERALAEFSSLPPYEPAGLLARKVAEANAMLQAPRANSRYVQHLFDQFSADYDHRMLGSLGYRAPIILRDLYGLVAGGSGSVDILDLGCGTGLAAAAFSDIAARIDGVDLSPQMIAKARARGLYADLAVADLEPFLASDGRTYDLIVAADTLVYLGDLAPTLAGVRGRLKHDGFFLFTVEKADGQGFELGPKRRWRHAEQYLRAVAAQTGLDLAGLLEASPRNEAGQPVDGFAVALCAG
jgi:predicted TPR repeat methyltransferase